MKETARDLGGSRVQLLQALPFQNITVLKCNFEKYTGGGGKVVHGVML